MSQLDNLMEENNQVTNNHKISTNWTIWAHMPQDSDWSLNGYIKINTLKNIEDSITLMEIIPEVLIKYSMLFIMKENINPLWEDKCNINGGAFSYKVSNKNVLNVWKKLFYALIGNTISNNIEVIHNITGITISPKKNFCVIKIWMKDYTIQNPDVINSEIIGLNPQGCIFKKHK